MLVANCHRGLSGWFLRLENLFVQMSEFIHQCLLSCNPIEKQSMAICCLSIGKFVF